MPEERLRGRFYTFASALSEIKDAAYNRRMLYEDYVGRAALAFAVHDSQGEIMWDEIMQKEPKISNLTMGGYAKSRERGRAHGPWQIVRLR